MLFKIIKQICYFFFVKLCKNSSLYVFCESAIFMTLFLPQEGKMWKIIGN